MALNFQAIAECIAAASKDPKYKIGAVIFDGNNNIRSTGYNGAPRGVMDLSERYQKPLKAFYISHAEENAIVQAARMGVSTDDCCMLIWGKTPCANCARIIIQAGIKSVLFYKEDIAESNYAQSFKAAFTMFKEAGVKVTYLKGE
jgi:dCMP deaminase